MKYVPLLLIGLLLVGLLVFSNRARRRQAATAADRVKLIGAGTEVMTTSGLYGTVVAVNGDGTVQLSVAPELELRWELAALRDLADLPGRGGTDADPPPQTAA